MPRTPPFASLTFGHSYGTVSIVSLGAAFSPFPIRLHDYRTPHIWGIKVSQISPGESFDLSMVISLIYFLSCSVFPNFDLNLCYSTRLTCIFPTFLDPGGLKSLEELSPVITALREIEATWSETVTWQDAAGRDSPSVIEHGWKMLENHRSNLSCLFFSS